MSEETQGITEETREVAQESVEDLKTQISALQAQLGEKDTKIQSLDKAISKRQSYDEGIAKLHERLNTQEETMAMLADYMEELRGTEPEQPSSTKARHQEALKQKREQAPSKPDPDAQRFFTYCEDVDLHIDYDSFEACAPLIKEALGEGRGFKDALKYVRDKVKANSEAGEQKRVDEAVKVQLERELKEHGLTASGSRGPSAPSETWRDLSPDEKIRLAVSKA